MLYYLSRIDLDTSKVNVPYLNDRVPHTNHVLGQVLYEREETPLCVEPGVRTQLLVIRLQGLDDPRDAELVVALGAVEGSNHQVDDAEVEHLGKYNIYNLINSFPNSLE